MLNAGSLEPTEQGWVFKNEAQVSAMLMKKNAPKRP
jgi:hypothetical protein